MPAVAAASAADIPAIENGLPVLAGWERELAISRQSADPVFLPQTNLSLEGVTAAIAIALHMHQPTVPAGAQGKLISYLQYMFEHPYEGDNHNAGPYAYCYARMGDFIPEMVNQGCNPRIMLDYSGNLLWGFQQMGRQDILNKLKSITCSPTYQPYVEWLGTLWGHATVASTPIPDIKLHILAWQHQFAALFGMEALTRVRGFSLPDMRLPSHPDWLFALVQTLQECGYRWLLVPEAFLETPQGQSLQHPHLPHQLVVRNRQGETLEITVLVKTQGIDSPLVGQMQPYQAAQKLQPVNLGGGRIPPLVSQIGDGENGGVMMNEFPSAFKRAWHAMRQQGGGCTGVVGCCGTEYLELLAAAGVSSDQLPRCQRQGHYRLWQRLGDTPTTADWSAAIAADDSTQASTLTSAWDGDEGQTGDQARILRLIQQLSTDFHRTVAPLQEDSEEHLSQRRSQPYQNALLHNLLLQTSCFRAWDQTTWTDYAQEIYRRGKAILTHDF